MKYSFLSLLICCSLITLISCKSSSEIDFEPKTLNHDELCSEYNYDIENNSISKGQFVISRGEEFSSWLSKINNSLCNLNPDDLDFTEYNYALIIDDVRGNRSHEISITEAREYQDSIEVHFSYIVNHGDFPEVMNQPILLIGIPKSPKQIVFREN